MVAHQSEIKGGEGVEGVVPKELGESGHWRKDLSLSSAYWLYSPERLLLLQKAKDKGEGKEGEEGPEEAAVRRSYRALGATACAALQ